MLQITKENFIYKNFIIISLLTCPIVVIAPLGSWVLLVLVAISASLFHKSFLNRNFFEVMPLVMFITFFWIIISTILIGKNFFILEKVLHFIVLILSGLILSNTKIRNSDFRKTIIVFSISFLVSTLLIIVDTKINLGLKLWLSKNFDFSNIENLFYFKYWISFNDFREKYFDIITSYNKNTYSRGIVGLTVLTLPLFILCYFYNLKLLGCTIIFASISLAFFTLNFTVLFCYIAALFFGSIFYFKKAIFKKCFLYLLGFYILLSPFILGKFDYTKFSDYERILFQKQNYFLTKYCEKRFANKKFSHIDNNKILLDRLLSDVQIQKCGIIQVKKNNSFQIKNLLEEVSTIEKIKLLIQFKVYNLALKKLHRLIIWSFVKEKILEKPVLGHGFFSSRFIVDEMMQTESLTKFAVCYYVGVMELIRNWSNFLFASFHQQ